MYNMSNLYLYVYICYICFYIHIYLYINVDCTYEHILGCPHPAMLVSGRVLEGGTSQHIAEKFACLA